MRILFLILGASLSACAAQQTAGLAPLVRDVTHVERVFKVTWAAMDVSATLVDDGSAPADRALLALGISVIERTTKCAVVDARLRKGALTVSAQIDCGARTVLDI